MPESINFAKDKRLSVLPRGGELFTQPVQPVTQTDLAALEQCASRWPQENQSTAAAVKLTFEQQPHVQQYLACETAFFHNLPEAAASYALPGSDHTQGLKRYGADGLFHAWIAKHFVHYSRIVSVHLTGSTTLAAIYQGQAVDTSSGYSLLEGLPGMTTCGDIDPSLILLLNEQGMPLDEIRDMLYNRSGWSAFSQTPLNYEHLLTSDEKSLELPRGMYLHSLIKQIGAMLSVMGGADRIILGTECAEQCEPILEKLRCHFNEKSLHFELYEIKRKTILLDLAKEVK